MKQQKIKAEPTFNNNITCHIEYNFPSQLSICVPPPSVIRITFVNGTFILSSDNDKDFFNTIQSSLARHRYFLEKIGSMYNYYNENERLFLENLDDLSQELIIVNTLLQKNKLPQQHKTVLESYQCQLIKSYQDHVATLSRYLKLFAQGMTCAAILFGSGVVGGFTAYWFSYFLISPIAPLTITMACVFFASQIILSIGACFFSKTFDTAQQFISFEKEFCTEALQNNSMFAQKTVSQESDNSTNLRFIE